MKIRRASAATTSRPRSRAFDGPRTLAVDVGGTGIKAIVLDPRGAPLGERRREPTPQPATPRAVLATIQRLSRAAGPFDRVSLGFPGVVVEGVVRTAPHLAERLWRGHDLRADVERALKRPAHVLNDAAIQGYGAVRGRGVEMILTFGTGVGSALFIDGRAVPLELGHHPWAKGKTYEERLGDAERRRIGNKHWSRRVRAAVRQIQAVFLPDTLYLGGGNSARLRGGLPEGVRVVSNDDGLLGGIRLWGSPHLRLAPRLAAAGGTRSRRRR